MVPENKNNNRKHNNNNFDAFVAVVETPPMVLLTIMVIIIAALVPSWSLRPLQDMPALHGTMISCWPWPLDSDHPVTPQLSTSVHIINCD